MDHRKAVEPGADEIEKSVGGGEMPEDEVGKQADGLPKYEEPLFEKDDGLIFTDELWRSLQGAQGCMQCSSCHGCR